MCLGDGLKLTSVKSVMNGNEKTNKETWSAVPPNVTFFRKIRKQNKSGYFRLESLQFFIAKRSFLKNDCSDHKVALKYCRPCALDCTKVNKWKQRGELWSGM